MFLSTMVKQTAYNIPKLLEAKANLLPSLISLLKLSTCNLTFMMTN